MSRCKTIRYGLLFMAVLGTAMLLAGVPEPGGVAVGIGVNIFTWVMAFLFAAFVDCSTKCPYE
ncbi:hypothetical protein [Acidithiobacillus ferrianus]|uniref:hypothetical protein n=1 Tax=Acidithiobacillus ferrianus TaxID=2678518 RepID=UPI0034E3D308